MIEIFFFFCCEILVFILPLFLRLFVLKPVWSSYSDVCHTNKTRLFADLVLKVPVGTMVLNERGQAIGDLDIPGQQVLFSMITIITLEKCCYDSYCCYFFYLFLVIIRPLIGYN